MISVNAGEFISWLTTT